MCSYVCADSFEKDKCQVWCRETTGAYLLLFCRRRVKQPANIGLVMHHRKHNENTIGMRPEAVILHFSGNGAACHSAKFIMCFSVNNTSGYTLHFYIGSTYSNAMPLKQGFLSQSPQRLQISLA